MSVNSWKTILTNPLQSYKLGFIHIKTMKSTVWFKARTGFDQQIHKRVDSVNVRFLEMFFDEVMWKVV